MARLHLNPGIDEMVAARFVAPAIKRVVQAVEDSARAAAPPTKQWHHQGDARVRPWHRRAGGLEVPDNLRFPVPKAPFRGVQHPPGVDMMREPRDPSAPPLQTLDCRCFTSRDPTGVARTIAAEPVQVTGARVSGRVRCDHPQAREAAHGTAEDEPTEFMRRGLAEGRAELRAR